jgi:hypothetical protein
MTYSNRMTMFPAKTAMSFRPFTAGKGEPYWSLPATAPCATSGLHGVSLEATRCLRVVSSCASLLTSSQGHLLSVDLCNRSREYCFESGESGIEWRLPEGERGKTISRVTSDSSILHCGRAAWQENGKRGFLAALPGTC